jgi:hypothetical protein
MRFFGATVDVGKVRRSWLLVKPRKAFSEGTA